MVYVVVVEGASSMYSFSRSPILPSYLKIMIQLSV